MMDQWLIDNLPMIVLATALWLMVAARKLITGILAEPGLYEGMSYHDKFWFDRANSWTRATTDYLTRHQRDFNLSDFQKYLYRSGKREVIDAGADTLVDRLCNPKNEGWDIGFNQKDPSGTKLDYKISYSFKF